MKSTHLALLSSLVLFSAATAARAESLSLQCRDARHVADDNFSLVIQDDSFESAIATLHYSSFIGDNLLGSVVVQGVDRTGEFHGPAIYFGQDFKLKVWELTYSHSGDEHIATLEATIAGKSYDLAFYCK